MNNRGSTPLEGTRILDFTWAWAGPYGTLLLGFMGAEIIKVESVKRPDHSRMRSLTGGPTPGIDRSVIFNDLNLNKYSVRLDLSKPQAADIVKRLAAKCDVVTANYRPGVMDKLGIGYQALREANPEIIVLASSAQGSQGPAKRYVGYAPTFSALGGMAYITGYPEGPPCPMTGSIDLRSATTSCFAVLAALYHKKKTGKGQFIDLSSTESIAVLMGEAFMDYQMNRRVQERNGNRDPQMAPHGVYRCKGDDSWVSIAVGNEEEWRGFKSAMGGPEWAEADAFSSMEARLRNQDELDRRVEAWTEKLTHYQVMETLQEKGVAAAPVFTSQELYLDPHTKERGVYQEVVHPAMGRLAVLSPPWKLSHTPATIRHASPLIGEHDNYVYGELLGMSPDEIKRLEKAKVIY
jgi:benzylsuccinate CoA-transferase BbsF subunit